MKLILLAAGKSSRIYNDIGLNKCLIKVKNKSLIQKIIDDGYHSGIKKIDVITGFKSNNIKQNLKKYNKLRFINNNKYNHTDMVHSALLGLKKDNTDTIISYTDIYFQKSIFSQLIKSKNKNITIPFIKNWKQIWKIRKKNIFEDAETFKIDKNSFLKEIGQKINKKNLKEIDGQFMGLIYIPKEHIKLVIKLYKKNNNRKLQFTGFLNSLIKDDIKLSSIEYKKFWYEIDDLEDYKNLKKIIKQ